MTTPQDKQKESAKKVDPALIWNVFETSKKLQKESSLSNAIRKEPTQETVLPIGSQGLKVPSPQQLAQEAEEFAKASGDLIKSIYGEDSRGVVPDPWKVSSKAVVSLWNKSQLVRSRDHYVLTTSLHVRAMAPNGVFLPLDENDRFFGEPTGPFGTGFLLEGAGADVVVTAGHCVVERDRPASAKNIAFVFGFDEKVLTSGNVRIPVDQVYFGKLVDYQLTGRNEDWAVIRLDRKVQNQSYCRRGSSKAGDLPFQHEIHVLGHPSGLSLKYANGQVRQNPFSQGMSPYFGTSLDTFAGNSGSPVFNSAQEVVGILVRGKEDYVWDPEKERMVAAVYSEHESGEDVSRIDYPPLVVAIERASQLLPA